jgi:hypothetical protein
MEAESIAETSVSFHKTTKPPKLPEDSQSHSIHVHGAENLKSCSYSAGQEISYLRREPTFCYLIHNSSTPEPKLFTTFFSCLNLRRVVIARCPTCRRSPGRVSATVLFNIACTHFLSLSRSRLVYPQPEDALYHGVKRLT